MKIKAEPPDHSRSVAQEEAKMKEKKKFTFSEHGQLDELSSSSSHDTSRLYNNEIQILKTLDHPYIIKYYESFVYKKELCIVTEFAKEGDLQKKIKEAK